MVKQAVGNGNRCAKLAEKKLGIPVTFYRGAEYVEVDIDIMSSAIARGILSVVRSAAGHVTLDLAFILEGVEPGELPERILGAVRIHRCDPFRAPELPPGIEHVS